MNRQAEVLVVGGGVIGLSIARSLTKRGVRDVGVLERAALAGGGTGKSSGIVRCHYGVSSLAAMAWRSLPTFENAAEIFGTDIGFHRTGYVVGVGAHDVEALEATTKMQQGLGIDVELVDTADVQSLMPAVRLDDYAGLSYEPRGGYGDGSQTAMAYSVQARDAGAWIRQSTLATSLLESNGRICGVELASGERISAGTVVVAAGAWSRPLLLGVGVDFPVWAERSELLVIDPGGPQVRMPVLSDLVSLQYTRVEGASGHLLVGNSDHSTPEHADPDNYSNRASVAGVERAVAKVAHRFPGFPNPSVAHTYAGCYDVTPDYNPVIAPVGPAGLFLAAGFSGHGFKISPAVGELVADLVLDGTSTDPDIPADDFRLERFAEGRLLVTPNPYVDAGQMR